MERETLKELYRKYDLTKEDFFKHQHYTIISRSGVEKIMAMENIAVTYQVVKVKKDFAVIKAIATKDNNKIETFGSALKGDFKTGNTQTWYVAEMAEKRAMARGVLKMTGFYKYNVKSEDESEDFRSPAVKQVSIASQHKRLMELLHERYNLIPEDERLNIERIIDQEEKESYTKAIKYLESCKSE